MSKIPPVAKVKEPSWTTMRKAWGPYKRLYSYALPYKWRFVVGLGFGFLYGFINGLMPLVMAKVAGVVFQGKGPVPPQQMVQHPELFTHGPEIGQGLILLCLAIPAVMTVRSLCGYANAYYMNWVSNKVLTDIRAQLFSKMIRQSMDFFKQDAVRLPHVANHQ